MQLPEGGAACKGGVLNDSQVGRHVYGFQSHAGVERGAADADQVLRESNPMQTAAAFKQAARDIRQAVRQRYAAQTGTVGECFLPDSTQPGKAVQTKRFQPITSHEGAASYVGEPAVFPYAQLGEGGAESKRTPSDGNDSVRQGYGAKESAALECPVGYRHNRTSVRRAGRHCYRNGSPVRIRQTGNDTSRAVRGGIKRLICQQYIRFAAIRLCSAEKIQICHTCDHGFRRAEASLSLFFLCVPIIAQYRRECENNV